MGEVKWWVVGNVNSHKESCVRGKLCTNTIHLCILQICYLQIEMLIAEATILLLITTSTTETICTPHSYVPESLDFSDEKAT